jgi:hypothetical protein
MGAEPALIVLRFSDPLEVDCGPQCPVRICAAVRASAFRILSRQDFLGGGGISSVLWWLGVYCQAIFAFLNFSEILSFRYAIDMTLE